MTEGESPRPKQKIPWCNPCTKAGWCMVRVGTEDVPYECMCGHLRRVASGMPPYIRLANVEKAHVHLSVVREPRANLYIEGHWNDMRAIAKILMMTGTNGHVLIVDEIELRDVYVGSMSKAAKSQDYAGVVYNNISEFVGPPDLLIVRLNTIVNKNKAMAGVLLEAVKVRTDYGKATWLLSDIEKPFSPSSLSYSDEVMAIIAARFKKVLVPRINKTNEQVATEFLQPSSSLSLDPEPEQRPEPKTRKIGHDPEAEPVRRPPRRRADEDREELPGGLGAYGSGVKQSTGGRFKK